MADRLPIIYVRGFAGRRGSGADEAADDPFYGFNAGATHIRVDGEGHPRCYQFEGPLLRLINEHGYRLRVQGSQGDVLRRAAPESLEPNTVWIYRYYDDAASTFGRRPRPFVLDDAAADLGDLIDLVLAKTAGASKVHLVAHSVGGLICRSLIQRHLEKPAERIAKVFTYGTPHGGIDPGIGSGLGDRDSGRDADLAMEKLGLLGAAIFQPEHMYDYLTPPGAGPRPECWDPRSLGETPFPVDRFFCLVGTNAADREAAAGLSTVATGPGGDGLVRIENAYVEGAERGYAHRSHSGRYGMVNSEEGYQNLQRFLFGDLRVGTELAGLDLDTSDGRSWQADLRLSIRGVPVLICQRTAEHHCPVRLTGGSVPPGGPVPLVTTYLLADRAPDGYARYALSLRVSTLREFAGVVDFARHLEQVAEWEDTLIVDVRTAITGGSAPGADAGAELRVAWNSQLAGEIANTDPVPGLVDLSPGTDPTGTPLWTASVPVSDTGRAVLGGRAELRLTLSPWS